MNNLSSVILQNAQYSLSAIFNDLKLPEHFAPSLFSKSDLVNRDVLNSYLEWCGVLSLDSEMKKVVSALKLFQGQFDFNGDLDITQFQKLASDNQIDLPKSVKLNKILNDLGYSRIGRARTQFSVNDNKHTIYAY